MGWYSDFSKKFYAYIDSYMPDGFTGNDALLAESVKKNFKPISYFAMGFGYGVSRSWLVKESMRFAHETVTNSSDSAKLSLVLSICALETARRFVNCYIEYNNSDLGNSLDRSIPNMSEEKVASLSKSKSLDYLDSIYDSIELYNLFAFGYGDKASDNIAILYNLFLASDDTALFTQIAIVESIQYCLGYITLAMVSRRESIIKEIGNIDDELTILRATYANQELVSVDKDFLKKQLDVLIERRANLEGDLKVYGNVIYLSSLVTSLYYVYQSISALQNIDASHASYSNLSFNSQKALHAIYSKDALDLKNLPNVNGLIAPVNIEEFNKAYKDLSESEAQMNQVMEANEVRVTVMHPLKKEEVVFYYDHDDAPKSVWITGENGLGKSCILKAIARANLLYTDGKATTTKSFYGTDLKKEDVVYIPQSEIKDLTKFTIYKNLSAGATAPSFLSVIPSFAAPQKPGENIAGITPMDIFTAFLTKEQRESKQSEIDSKVNDLINALDIKIFKDGETQEVRDLNKCMEIVPSGGEQHKIKFIMLALSALYGQKKLILVDELYNDLDTKSKAVIEGQFKKLLNDVDKSVKFISTDHTRTTTDGLYNEERKLESQSIS